MDNVAYLKMSRLARLLLYISDADNAFRSNRLYLKRLEDFPNMIFLEKQQNPAICDL